MANRVLKIVPDSEAEARFMELLSKVDVKPNSISCRLGEVFGWDYNEYTFTDEVYQQIHDYLLNEEAQH